MRSTGLTSLRGARVMIRMLTMTWRRTARWGPQIRSPYSRRHMSRNSESKCASITRISTSQPTGAIRKGLGAKTRIRLAPSRKALDKARCRTRTHSYFSPGKARHRLGRCMRCTSTNPAKRITKWTRTCWYSRWMIGPRFRMRIRAAMETTYISTNPKASCKWEGTRISCRTVWRWMSRANSNQWGTNLSSCRISLIKKRIRN